MARILIVDDDRSSLNALNRILRTHPLFKEGTLQLCDRGEEALGLLERERFDILLCDIRMPRIDGKQVFQAALKGNSVPYIVMMTGFSSLSEAVSYMRDGAYDYIKKPFEKEELEALIDRIGKEISLKEQVRNLQHQLAQNQKALPFIFSCEEMTKVHQTIQALEESDFNVLILGESGTGKEVVADALHYSSNRREGPFIKVNCAGLVENLLESEIFGHEKGAFTGALQAKKGKFELARGGTLFLDEIGDMPTLLQAKFLRVLQDGSYQRVGGEKTLTSDARIVAATNHDLEQDMDRGLFRQDLYYRLNTVTLRLPPLRERRTEIPELSLFFLSRLNGKYKKRVERISPELMDLLLRLDYPGNVRELENIVTRSYATARSDCLSVEDLPEEIRRRVDTPSSSSSPSVLSDSLLLEPAVESLEKNYMRRALKESGGNKVRAAELLGITRRILYYKLEKYGELQEG